jgi:amino acid adenylation domain-containing protein
MKIGDFLFDEPAASPKVASSVIASAEPSRNIIDRFRQVAAQHASRLAVADEEGSLTYAELDTLSERIARFVASLDLGQEAVVGLMLDRHRNFVAAALGAQKAGAAYLPIDPGLPLPSRRRLLDISRVRLLISQQSLAGDLQRLQWLCPELAHIMALDAEDFDSLMESPGILMSPELWDHLAAEEADDVAAGGWKSAFTGQLLPLPAMMAFGENVRRKVEPLLAPGSRVLEIGCASGFVMRHVAPLAGSYLAVDISRRNVERVENHARALGLEQVSTRQMAAHDVDIFPPASFDLVIMASVAESFPGYGYLRVVLDKARQLLAPGGHIFLGSIWDLDRRDAYFLDLNAFAREHAGQGFTTRRESFDDLFVPREFFRDWATERGGMRLAFSPLDAPGFEPAAYEYDLLVYTESQEPASSLAADVPAPSRRRHDRRALEALDAGHPLPAPAPGQAAYVIFTSGTTGLPKGAVVEHHSVVNLAEAIGQVVFAKMNAAAGLAVSCNASLAFDASAHQIFSCLLNGHTVHMPGEDTRRDPARLAAFAQQRRLDLLESTPSLFAMLIDHWRESGTRTIADTVILGGEPVPSKLLEGFYSLPGHGDVRVINAYGPTECCVAACHHDMTAAGWRETLPPPVGRPLPGVVVEVRDSAGRPLPEGVPGEIVIGGEGVGRGYLNAPEETARSFTADEQGRRWYRSGDMGVWLPGGVLRFLGREDRQVKIRGNRIELSEVEATLNAHPLVKRAAVVALDLHGEGDRLLAGYLTTLPGLDLAELKAGLDASLPAYMVPSWLVPIDEIPLTANGKLDEARLPRPALATAEAGKPANPPTTDVEKRLAALWREILETPVSDIDANFFAQGGHSVLAVRLLGMIAREFGVRLPLSELFASPSVASLAKRIEAGSREDSWQTVVQVNPHGRAVPLVCFHPVGGNVLCYQALTESLGPDQPIFMVQAQGLEKGQALLPTVEDMVAAYLPAMRRTLPQGPLVLAGWSFGGTLAYEAACRLQRAGVEVRALLLFDALAVPDPIRQMLRQDDAQYLADLFADMGIVTAEELRGLGPTERLDLILERARGTSLAPDGTDREGMRRLLALFQNNALAAVRYRPPHFSGRLLLVRPRVASRTAPGLPDRLNGWGPLVSDGVELRWMDCAHGQMLLTPYIDQLAGFVLEHLDQANRTAQATSGAA